MRLLLRQKSDSQKKPASVKLNSGNLNILPPTIPGPLYNRSEQKHSIVHIGVGGFHRAHQAFYLDKLLNEGVGNWAVCGVGVKSEDEIIYKLLSEQDYLYTLIIKHSDGSVCPRIIGSVVDYIFVPKNRAAAIEKLADPITKIVSLTITEGGYNFDAEGNFILDNPDIEWDLEYPKTPKTVFGLLTAAIRLRKERNIAGFTLLSCDNIQQNGDMLRKMLVSFAEAADKELPQWIEANITFPNSMVDRITPVTTKDDIKLLNERYGVRDAWPVTCEPFAQWVLEDDFAGGRPALELVGVQFVQNIEPYEKVKIRLLNAGHSLLGFFGSLSGYETINEAVGDPVIRKALRAFMDEEAAPTLGVVEGIDLNEYKESLIRRFANPHIGDRLIRICSDSSDKLPKFLIPTIKEQMQRGGSIRYGITILAAWCRALELHATGQYGYPVRDSMLGELMQAAVATAERGTAEFLQNTVIFGDLPAQPGFTNQFMERLNDIRTLGIESVLQKLNES